MTESDTSHDGRRHSQTRLSVKLSDSERKKKRDEILPHGVYPKTYRKGQMPVRSSYYVPTVRIANAGTRRATGPELAVQMLNGIPKGLGVQRERNYWERMLLETYYYLYGKEWNRWTSLIPWLDRQGISSKAKQLGCDQTWEWTDRRRFIDENSLHWTLSDLDYLIDRYPDRQINDSEQSIYVGDKPFSEIQAIAEALRLPTNHSIRLLSEYAAKLNSRV